LKKRGNCMERSKSYGSRLWQMESILLTFYIYRFDKEK
jgi:hypothetical protein